MRNLLRAILRRCIAFALVFVLGVSVVMIRVYYLHDEELGSDPLDVSSIREEYLLHWRTPYSFKVSIPPEGDLTDERVFRYPHPLLLIVSVDDVKRIFLNREQYGTLADTSVLRERLSRLFDEREVTGAYRTVRDLRTGSIQRPPIVEKTVRVEVPHTFTYGDVIELIDAIKAAGADPIDLQIDGRINKSEFTSNVPEAVSHR
jgi:biopolymer transport protein ExbD